MDSNKSIDKTNADEVDREVPEEHFMNENDHLAKHNKKSTQSSPSNKF